MNYRHIYHAGNFADVLKHAIQVAVLNYMKKKDKPFFVLDTHGGIGRYDLSSEEAQKTGEFHQGIELLMNAADRPAFFDDYIAEIEALNPRGGIRRYPGSPYLTSMLLRDQDRMTACELHPDDAETLDYLFEKDKQVRILHQDGYAALKAFLPPPERRGLVLIDPPFEKVDEFESLVKNLKQGLKRFATGTYIVWYPIKQRILVEQFFHAIGQSGIRQDMLRCELLVRGESDQSRFNGSGLLVINPPWKLQEELSAVLPWLCDLMAQDDGASWFLAPVEAA